MTTPDNVTPAEARVALQALSDQQIDGVISGTWRNAPETMIAPCLIEGHGCFGHHVTPLGVAVRALAFAKEATPSASVERINPSRFGQQSAWWNSLVDAHRRVLKTNASEALNAAFYAGWDRAVAALTLPVPSAPQGGGETGSWQPMETAPRDDTLLELVVDYSADEADHPLADSVRACTIGFNGFDNHGVDEWKFAGWCWTHDHFVQGKGKPIAWRPSRLNATDDALSPRPNLSQTGDEQ